MSRHSNTPDTDASVLLVQLSDSHLFAEDGARLLGMDTAYSLEKVVERVAREQPSIDLILATGDVSQDGSLDSYARFRRLSAPLAAPLRWFAGNHDEREPMQQATAGSDLLEQVVDVGNWRVVLLDSSIPGAVPGYLEEDQLELLRRAIDSAGERFLLVSFHHHPVPIGSGAPVSSRRCRSPPRKRCRRPARSRFPGARRHADAASDSPAPGGRG